MGIGIKMSIDLYLYGMRCYESILLCDAANDVTDSVVEDAAIESAAIDCGVNVLWLL